MPVIDPTLDNLLTVALSRNGVTYPVPSGATVTGRFFSADGLTPLTDAVDVALGAAQGDAGEPAGSSGVVALRHEVRSNMLPLSSPGPRPTSENLLLVRSRLRTLCIVRLHRAGRKCTDLRSSIAAVSMVSTKRILRHWAIVTIAGSCPSVSPAPCEPRSASWKAVRSTPEPWQSQRAKYCKHIAIDNVCKPGGGKRSNRPTSAPPTAKPSVSSKHRWWSGACSRQGIGTARKGEPSGFVSQNPKTSAPTAAPVAPSAAASLAPLPQKCGPLILGLRHKLRPARLNLWHEQRP